MSASRIPSYLLLHVLIGRRFALISSNAFRLIWDVTKTSYRLTSQLGLLNETRGVQVPSTQKNSNTISRLLRAWSATAIASILGIGLVLMAVLTDFDLVKLNPAFLERIDKRSADDIVLGVAIIFVGLAVDLSNRRRRRQTELAAQRLRVLKATMRTVQDIVNNLLNNIQLFRMDAEGALPEETLKQLDAVVEEAASQIRALGNLDEVKEKQMALGVGIDYTSEPTNVA